jgi:hypothetical protein
VIDAHCVVTGFPNHLDVVVIAEGDGARRSRRVFTVVRARLHHRAGGDADWCMTSFTIRVGGVLNCADATTH